MKFTGILCLTCTCISFLVIAAIGLRANLLIRRACRGRYTRRDSFTEFEMHSFFRSGYCINECNRLEGISDTWESGTEADGSFRTQRREAATTFSFQLVLVFFQRRSESVFCASFEN